MKFKVAAKTDVGLVRTNNEDNFQVASDLTQPIMSWVNNEVCDLGEKGALLVVADGMGGMNAGEVASEIAIKTVKEFFTPDNITADVMKNNASIERYMNEAITAADCRIKEEAKSNPETKGMGTTIVIGWILGNRLFVSWCGDSRAYIFNPESGLTQISKDHSYVQALVDKGALSKEDAFDFPESNIITRCLSDSSSKAKPENLKNPYQLKDHDIVMLCTDGLNGMIRDNEIEEIMENDTSDLNKMLDDLIQGAKDAEGSDNITICLCEVLEGGAKAPLANDNSNNDDTPVASIETTQDKAKKKNKFPMVLMSACAVAFIIGVVWIFIPKGGITTDVAQQDSTTQDETLIPFDTPGEGDVTPGVDESVKQPETSVKNPENTEVKPEENEAESKPDNHQEATTDQTLTPIESVADPEPQEDVLTPVGQPQVKEQPENDNTPKYETYTVKKGDSYYSLAKKYNIKVEELQKINDNRPLKIGDKIKVIRR